MLTLKLVRDKMSKPLSCYFCDYWLAAATKGLTPHHDSVNACNCMSPSDNRVESITYVICVYERRQKDAQLNHMEKFPTKTFKKIGKWN